MRLLLLLICAITSAQELTYAEYMGMVRTEHPLVKSAGLQEDQARASLLEARGNFDPSVEAGAAGKEFDKPYYTLREGVFKVPTWFGPEFKAGYENNDGEYLNPQSTVPDQGLFSIGVKVPLGQGLWINKRMADVRKAQLMVRASVEERKIRATEVLHAAATAYFKWKQQYQEAKLYEEYYQVALQRINGIKTMVVAGERAAIDSVEASISVQQRLLGLQDAQLKLIKARYDLSLYLWQGDTPVEVTETAYPQETVVLELPANVADFSVDAHPKFNQLQLKVQSLEVERRLRANALLPKFDVGYDYLVPELFDSPELRDRFKFSAQLEIPLFLRRERGALKLAKFQLQDARLAAQFQALEIQNKVAAGRQEIENLQRQQNTVKLLVDNHLSMVRAEERLFGAGESSLFLINTREASLISARLSQLALENRFLTAYADLYRTLVEWPE